MTVQAVRTAARTQIHLLTYLKTVISYQSNPVSACTTMTEANFFQKLENGRFSDRNRIAADSRVSNRIVSAARRIVRSLPETLVLSYSSCDPMSNEVELSMIFLSHVHCHWPLSFAVCWQWNMHGQMITQPVLWPPFCHHRANAVEQSAWTALAIGHHLRTIWTIAENVYVSLAGPRCPVFEC